MSLTRQEAQGWLDQVTEAITNGNTDSITPVITAAAVAFALLDVADAIREQTAEISGGFEELKKSVDYATEHRR